MKIGVIPPVPMEPFLASTHEATNLWASYFLSFDRSEEWKTADLADLSNNFPAWAKWLYGASRKLDLDVIYYPRPGVSKEVMKAIEAMSEQDVEAVPFSFPLMRNEYRLKEELGVLYRRLEVEAGMLASVVLSYQQVRTVLRRFDALQQKTGGFSSWNYVSMLARCMDPKRDLFGLRKTVETGILDYKDLGRGRWLRIGVLGVTPCRRAFYEALEGRGAVVVYDEWGVENNPMIASTDLVHLYHHCSLPYGLMRRKERILAELKVRRIDGLAMGVECLSDSIRDEGFFRSSLGLPVYSIENRGEGDLTVAEEMGVDHFIRRVEKSR